MKPIHEVSLPQLVDDLVCGRRKFTAMQDDGKVHTMYPRDIDSLRHYARAVWITERKRHGLDYQGVKVSYIDGYLTAREAAIVAMEKSNTHHGDVFFVVQDWPNYPGDVRYVVMDETGIANENIPENRIPYSTEDGWY
jgi:hypothetical protein